LHDIDFCKSINFDGGLGSGGDRVLWLQRVPGMFYGITRSVVGYQRCCEPPLSVFFIFFFRVLKGMAPINTLAQLI